MAHRRVQLPDAAHRNGGAAVPHAGPECPGQTGQQASARVQSHYVALLPISPHVEIHDPPQAGRLVQEVHDVLGRQRNGSARLGPATDEAPLLGGLRIGKADPEGPPDGDGPSLAAGCCMCVIARGQPSL